MIDVGISMSALAGMGSIFYGFECAKKSAVRFENKKKITGAVFGFLAAASVICGVVATKKMASIQRANYLSSPSVLAKPSLK